jgi:hypothetical protein
MNPESAKNPKSAMINLINLEKFWTSKTSPDVIRGTFNTELLRSVVQAKLEQVRVK